MNRTIKFRGKRLDNGEWVYGFVVINKDGKCFIKDTDYNINNGKVDIIPYQIIPETVGQFTGLLDKNGKEIYEGDVLLIPDYTHGAYFGKQQPTKRIVVQFQKTFNGIGYYGLPKSDEIEVIGNIHDNHELLEDKQ